MTDTPKTAALKRAEHTATLPGPPTLDGWIGGVPARLADFECEHGRLNGDNTRSCGCWPGEDK